jgi:hypothetical protein
MDYWEIAERQVAELTGGRLTPGSGNKSLKGDVRLPGWVFECKQTSKKVLTLQAEWFRKLELESIRNEVALVIYFDLRGYVYWHTNPGDPNAPDWKTKSLVESELPEKIVTKKATWILDNLESLRNVRN